MFMRIPNIIELVAYHISNVDSYSPGATVQLNRMEAGLLLPLYMSVYVHEYNYIIYDILHCNQTIYLQPSGIKLAAGIKPAK